MLVQIFILNALHQSGRDGSQNSMTYVYPKLLLFFIVAKDCDSFVFCGVFYLSETLPIRFF